MQSCRSWLCPFLLRRGGNAVRWSPQYKDVDSRRYRACTDSLAIPSSMNMASVSNSSPTPAAEAVELQPSRLDNEGPIESQQEPSNNTTTARIPLELTPALNLKLASAILCFINAGVHTRGQRSYY